MDHGVVVCNNSATNQAYCYFYKDRRSLQFSDVNTFLRDIGYGDIHFLLFSLRSNWHLYHPTTPLVEGEAAVQGELNEHPAFRRIQEPRSLPPPANIKSLSDSRKHSPLKSWEHTSPEVSYRTALSYQKLTAPENHAPPTPPQEPTPRFDINAIIQEVLQVTLAANDASVAENPTPPSLAPKITQIVGQTSDNVFIKYWNRYLHSFPIFQAHIRTYFERTSFSGVTNITISLNVKDHQISLLRLRLMSGLLTDKVLNIFLQNPTYKRYGFKMWGCILKKYNPRGKNALFERISDLYTLDKTQDESIIDYMSHTRRIFSGLHGITFNTMENIFIIVSSKRSRFGALVDRFCAGDPRSSTHMLTESRRS